MRRVAFIKMLHSILILYLLRFCTAQPYSNTNFVATISPFGTLPLTDKSETCPCLFTFFVNTTAPEDKVAIYVTDNASIQRFERGQGFSYTKELSVPAPGTNFKAVEYLYSIGRWKDDSGIAILVQNLQPKNIYVHFSFNVFPAMSGKATVASGDHIVIPFARTCPCHFNFLFIFDQKRCYVGALLMNDETYEQYKRTNQPPLTLTARRYYFLGLQEDVNFDAYLHSTEHLNMVLLNVNQRSRAPVNVSYFYNIVYPEPPQVLTVSSCPPSGGRITVTGRNFGRLGRLPGLKVSVGDKACSDAEVVLANYQIACVVPAGTEQRLDVVVTVAGLSSGDSGLGKFSYDVGGAPQEGRQVYAHPEMKWTIGRL